MDSFEGKKLKTAFSRWDKLSFYGLLSAPPLGSISPVSAA
jgi:hypothetical protein